MSDQLHVGQHVESGEVSCPECADRIAALAEARGELAAALEALRKAEIQQAGDGSTIRSLSFKLEELKRDKDEEAREHDLWNDVLDLFDLWRVAAGAAEGKKKKRSQLTGDRFWMALPFLKKWGPGICQAAIIGRCFDHYTDEQANGKPIHYHEWERIFGKKGKAQSAADNFEGSVAKRPDDWKKRVETYGFEVGEIRKEAA